MAIEFYIDLYRKQDSPYGCFSNFSKHRFPPPRADWEAVKAVLLGTGGETLIEAARNDSYWGYGPDGKGQNKLGLTLMEIRNELR